MAQRNRAAVGVDLGRICAGLLDPRQDDGSERLVDLDDVDVVDAQASSPTRARWPGWAPSIMIGSSPRTVR